MYFVAICWDREGVGEAGEQAHPKHLEYMAAHAKHLLGGGPIADLEGRTVGTLFLLDLPTPAEAQTFLTNEPYHTSGCFEASLLRRYRQMAPAVSPEAGRVAAEEATLALKQSGLA